MHLKCATKISCLVVVVLLLFQSGCTHVPGFRTDTVAELKQLAGEGNSHAQLLLAQLLDEGAGTPRDQGAALGWYRKSAASGNPDASFELADLQLSGRVASQAENTVRLLFKAGKGGNTTAQALLGSLYILGRDKDEFASQVKSARNGAEKGDAHSQYLLGWILREGAGQKRATTDAQFWLKKSAKQGNNLANLLLGDMALSGETGHKDIAAAVNWYEKAVSAGDRTAAVRLSLLQRKGIRTRPHTEPVSRQLSRHEGGYRRLQLEFIESQSAAHPESAFVAARRLLTLDPADREAQTVAERLAERGGSQSASLFTRAEQHLASGEFRSFSGALAKIISLNPDEMRLRELVARYWHRIDEPFRKMEKELLETVHALEGFDTAENVRKNESRIRQLISSGNETAEKWEREKPGDPRLTAALKKFERAAAAIVRKLEAQQMSISQPIDPTFIKGVSLLEGGKFDAAAKLFEMLARTPGYSKVADAYIYLGIATLARVDPSRVHEAKKLRLKGIASFQNALRFDGKATLPAGYLKYKDVFDEASSSFN